MSIVELGPHDKMTPEQALAVAAREPWEHVLVVGFHQGEETLTLRSSHMTREFALWITEHLKMRVLGL